MTNNLLPIIFKFLTCKTENFYDELTPYFTFFCVKLKNSKNLLLLLFTKKKKFFIK